MTSNAAALLRVENTCGAIAPTQAADIIAMPHNPIEDISALKTIHFVMKDGKVIRRPKAAHTVSRCWFRIRAEPTCTEDSQSAGETSPLRASTASRLAAARTDCVTCKPDV
jgi:hypothetical protein